MIMLYGSQRDYDMLAGKVTDSPAWTPDEIAKMHAFMGAWNQELVESGEFVDAQGLTPPVHARRVQLRNGGPGGTDGPYPEAEEGPAGPTSVGRTRLARARDSAPRPATSRDP